MQDNIKETEQAPEMSEKEVGQNAIFPALSNVPIEMRSVDGSRFTEASSLIIRNIARPESEFTGTVLVNGHQKFVSYSPHSKRWRMDWGPSDFESKDYDFSHIRSMAESELSQLVGSRTGVLRFGPSQGNCVEVVLGADKLLAERGVEMLIPTWYASHSGNARKPAIVTGDFSEQDFVGRTFQIRFGNVRHGEHLFTAGANLRIELTSSHLDLGECLVEPGMTEEEMNGLTYTIPAYGFCAVTYLPMALHSDMPDLDREGGMLLARLSSKVITLYWDPRTEQLSHDITYVFTCTSDNWVSQKTDNLIALYNNCVYHLEKMHAKKEEEAASAEPSEVDDSTPCPTCGDVNCDSPYLTGCEVERISSTDENDIF